MAATTTKFAEDGTTELVFADGVVTRVPSAILYDSLGNPLLTTTGDGLASAGLLGIGQLGFNGSTWDRLRVANVFKNIALVAVTAGTPVAIWTPATGKRFRLLGWVLSSNSSTTPILLRDGTAGGVGAPLVAYLPQIATNVAQVSPPLGLGFLSGTINNALTLDVGASGGISGFVFGTEE